MPCAFVSRMSHLRPSGHGAPLTPSTVYEVLFWPWYFQAAPLPVPMHSPFAGAAAAALPVDAQTAMSATASDASNSLHDVTRERAGAALR